MDITSVKNRLAETNPRECFRLDSYYRQWLRSGSRFAWQGRELAIGERKTYVKALLERDLISVDEAVELASYSCGWSFWTTEEVEQLRDYMTSDSATV